MSLKVLGGAVGCGLLAMLVVGEARAAGPTAERVNGTYFLENDSTRAASAIVEATSKGTVRVSLDISNGYGSFSSGVGTGEGKLRGNAVTLGMEAGQPACKITLTFAPGNALLVAQQGGSFECGFGNAVTADGQYTKARGGKLPLLLKGAIDARPQDPKALTQLSSDAAAEAQAAPGVIAGKAARIAELAASRKALKDALGKHKKELDARSKAGMAAAKKRDAAAGKPNAQPSASTFAAAAQTEFAAAQSAGREAVKVAAQLRAVEDELAQLVAESNQAAVDAKLGLADLRKAQKSLKALVTKERDEAGKLAAAAQQDATKGSTLVGVSAAQLEAKREKARVDDAKLSADAAAARASLKQVEASLKGAKR